MKRPAPNSSRFIQILLGQQGGTPPLVEYLVDEVVMRPILENILGCTWVNPGNDRDSQRAYLDNFIAFWHGMGYDFVLYEQNRGLPPLQVPAADTAVNSTKIRMWVEQHKGIITT